MADYYFIVNCKSRTGKAKEIWGELKEELNCREISYEAHITEHEGHATELAEEISSMDEPAIRIIVAGGDGTFNEVLNGITDFSKVQMGFIPIGSGNDLGRGMGWKTRTPLEQLDRILSTETSQTMDLGCVSWNGDSEKRIFAISSGIGLDADVCKQALTTKMKNVLNAVGLGNLTYVLLTVKTLFAMETSTAIITRSDGKSRCLEKLICLVAMNLRYEGGGVPMAPHAVPTDGKLSFCCISGIPKWRTFLCLPFLVAGRHEKIKGFDIINASELEIEIGQKMIVHADGEYCGDRYKVKFKCLPGILHMI